MLLVAKCMQYDRQEPQPFFSSIDLPHLYQILLISNKQKEKKNYGIGLYMYICIYFVLVLFDSSPPSHSISNLIFVFFFFGALIYISLVPSQYFLARNILYQHHASPLFLYLSKYTFFSEGAYTYIP